jgi:ribosomal-protein-alanine N-acetyltransferase
VLREEENNSEVTSNMNWIIEEANWRDFTQLQHLEKRSFRSDDLWPFWDLIGILTLPGMISFKAVVDHRMVGFIGGEKQALRKMGWVTNLAVLPDYRRQGIASALLLEFEKSFNDIKTIRLSVRASNNAAIQLYQGLGYKIVDRWKGYYTGGEDALVFEKLR